MFHLEFLVKMDYKTLFYESVNKTIAQKNLIGSLIVSEVFKGTFRKAQVAVKKIKRQGQEESEKILAEACIMTSLKHPNLLRLIGVVTDDPIMMLVEYCDKVTAIKSSNEKNSPSALCKPCFEMVELYDQISYWLQSFWTKN